MEKVNFEIVYYLEQIKDRKIEGEQNGKEFLRS